MNQNEFDEFTDVYVMGRSAAETRRLQAQGGFYAPYTYQLLKMAGIRPGMRVIDVGCGAGDVTMQIAAITGESGSVTGVDSDPAVLAVAARRAADAGLLNVTFRQASLPDVRLDGPVDAITGRAILLHLDDPAAAVRALSRLLRPGGIMTFQEFNITRARSVPPLPLVAQCIEWVCQAYRAVGRDPDTGQQLFSVFLDAGLPAPQMTVAVPAMRGPAVCANAAGSVTSVLPVLEKAGIATREEVDPGTLAERLWEQARACDALMIMAELAAAWTQMPGSRTRTPLPTARKQPPA
jgi:2-polyprenyl-3-methyl-5-hydroxy-6-metoxy-1,4-benzoquinol methylase